jgi:hypothetical protein
MGVRTVWRNHGLSITLAVFFLARNVERDG